MKPIVFSLDLLDFRDSLKTRYNKGRFEVWDPVRKGYFLATPEEIVRQLLLLYLKQHAKLKLSRVSVERAITVNGELRRYDLVIFDKQAQPFALVECKRPEYKLNQSVVDQAGKYNYKISAPWMIICNGPETICLYIDQDSKTILSAPGLPLFS